MYATSSSDILAMTVIGSGKQGTGSRGKMQFIRGRQLLFLLEKSPKLHTCQKKMRGLAKIGRFEAILPRSRALT